MTSPCASNPPIGDAKAELFRALAQVGLPDPAPAPFGHLTSIFTTDQIALA